MLANVLLVGGVLLLFLGVYLKVQEPAVQVAQVAPPMQAQEAEPVAEADAPPPETSAEKGLAFETWVVARFPKEDFVLKEWQGDKHTVNGIYPEKNQHPDLVYSLQLDQASFPLAVECKWRQKFWKDEVEFAYPQQLDRYRNFQHVKGMPVFVVLGVGGNADAPGSIYIIPVDKAGNGTLSSAELEPFKAPMRHKAFFYDVRSKELRF